MGGKGKGGGWGRRHHGGRGHGHHGPGPAARAVEGAILGGAIAGVAGAVVGASIAGAPHHHHHHRRHHGPGPIIRTVEDAIIGGAVAGAALSFADRHRWSRRAPWFTPVGPLVPFGPGRWRRRVKREIALTTSVALLGGAAAVACYHPQTTRVVFIQNQYVLVPVSQPIPGVEPICTGSCHKGPVMLLEGAVQIKMPNGTKMYATHVCEACHTYIINQSAEGEVETDSNGKPLQRSSAASQFPLEQSIPIAQPVQMSAQGTAKDAPKNETPSLFGFAAAAPPASAPAVTSLTPKFCCSCGTKLITGAKFCQGCGVKV